MLLKCGYGGKWVNKWATNRVKENEIFAKKNTNWTYYEMKKIMRRKDSSRWNSGSELENRQEEAEDGWWKWRRYEELKNEPGTEHMQTTVV